MQRQQAINLINLSRNRIFGLGETSSIFNLISLTLVFQPDITSILSVRKKIKINYKLFLSIG